jgi:glycosyltransferase involved in cell wall biosynthesis
MNPEDIHLVLFLSRATPISRWERIGILERELAIYKSLVRKLKSISIVTSGGSEELNYLDKLSGIRLLYNRFRLPPNLYSLLAPFIHYSELKKATVIKTNQLDGSWSAILAGKLVRKPVIVRSGYLWAEVNRQSGNKGLKARLIGYLQAYAYRHANAVFLTTQEMADHVQIAYQVPNRKITVIPNSVDTSLFSPQPELKKTKGRIIFVGRLNPIKNLHQLFMAVSQIPGMSLVLVGAGELRLQLEQLGKELNIPVEFKGLLRNEAIPHEIQVSEIFILPSIQEGHPKALLEAMSCGAAVIGTNVPGINNLIQNNVNGLLCEPDAKSIKEAIECLSGDAELVEKLGNNARRYILDHFMLDKVVDAELKAIVEMCSKSK